MDTSESTSPVFIVGCERSGTTLLQTLVDAHPNCAIPPESHFYNNFGSAFADDGRLLIRDRQWLLDRLVRDMRIRTWGLDFQPDILRCEIREWSRRGIAAALFRLYAAQHGKARWGDKSPPHVHHLHTIRRDFPDARIIHVVRDGRDAAASLRRMPWGPTRAVPLAERWKEAVDAADRFFAAVDHAGCLTVRYEDLVCDPEHTMHRVFDFLDERSNTVSNTQGSGALAQRYLALDPVHRSLAGPVRSNRIGDYRKHLSPRDITVFEALAGPTLRAHGYEIHELSAQPPVAPVQAFERALDGLTRRARKLKRPDLLREIWRRRAAARRARRRRPDPPGERIARSP